MADVVAAVERVVCVTWWVDPPQPAMASPASRAALKPLYLVVDNPGKRSGCQMQSQLAYRRAGTRKPLEYDALRHRLWIFGQRCHHGAAGTIAAAFACAGLIAEPAHAVRPAGPRSGRGWSPDAPRLEGPLDLV